MVVPIKAEFYQTGINPINPINPININPFGPLGVRRPVAR